MKLNKRQKNAVLKWVAEGVETAEMNKRAAKFHPPFSLLPSQVTFYRQTRERPWRDVIEEEEFNALKSGLAIVNNRVTVLQQLAEKLIADLLPEGPKDKDNKRWVLQVKGIGNGPNYERVTYHEFNRAEIDALRGILEDIAAEVGERRRHGANLNIDVAKLTDAQLERIANGEDPLKVIADA